MKEILDTSFWSNTVENYLWFTGIILLSVVFKRFISKKISALILKLFKRFKTDANEIDNFFSLLIKPVELLIVLLGFSFAFNVLNYPPVADGEFGLKNIITISLQVLIVISATWIVVRVIDFFGLVLLRKAQKTPSPTDDNIIQFVKEALKILTYIFSFLFILGAIFKLNIGALVAGLGIGGLAVALAAQDTIENVIASFIIFFDKPFAVGDFIKVGDEYGVVEKIGFRSTRIRTLEKSYLTLPNKTLITDKLDNLSLRTFRRAKFNIGVTYNTSIEQIKSIVNDIQKFIDDHPRTNQDGLVRFSDFGSSSLDIMVLFYVDTMEWSVYLEVKEEINYKIIEIVAKHGSSFAFPTQTIYLEK